MSQIIKLIRVDGALKIIPAPPYLTDYLQYSHRSFKTVRWQQVNDFQKRLLYSLDSDGGVITLPGFYEKVLKLIDKNNDLVVEEDHRTPMLNPDWHAINNMNWNGIGSTGLRDYQVDQVIELINAIQRNNGIVHCTGGAGKTIISACVYAAYNNLNTILAVPLKEVFTQTYDKFVKLFPNKTIGRMGDGYHELSSDITITTYKSLDGCALEKCQLLLADEIQSCAGDKIVQSFCKATPIRSVGFSATIDRLFNQAEKVLKGLFGEVAIKMHYSEAVDSEAVVPGIVYFVKIPPNAELVTASNIGAKISQGIKGCLYRNKMIGKICASIPREYQTFVFVDHIDSHLIPLYKHMPVGTQYFHRNSNKKEVGKFALTSKQQKQVLQEFKDNKFQWLIATDCARAGLSVDNIRVVVQASGGTSEVEILQEAFRGSRTMSEAEQLRLGVGPKTHFVLIDFIDSHDAALEDMSYSRMETYKKQGWQINVVEEIKDIEWINCVNSLKENTVK